MCRLNPTQLSEVKSIEKAIKVLDTMCLNEEEREVYEARLKWLRDEEMALKKAEKKGMERGIEQGVEKNKKETVIKMLRKGMDISDIIDIIDLSKEKIEEIKKNIDH